MNMVEKRKAMVESLISEGILKKERVIKSFLETPRELFVPEKQRNCAYVDEPLSIGGGQTISAPHMVAIMSELLEPRKTDRVLEIGSGSGYQAAILSKLVKEVYTIELDPELVKFSRSNLKKAGIKNVKVFLGDGSKGLERYGPFDKIIVTCGCPEIPEALIEQLKEGGIMVIPVGSVTQILMVGRKRGNNLDLKRNVECVFVPLRH